MNGGDAPARRRLGRLFRRWAGAFVVLAAVLALHSRFALVMVSGHSMSPTLLSGDLILVKRASTTDRWSRGDVVVARDGRDLIVKRVVALPGEEVELQRGRLIVNGEPVPPDHPITPGTLTLRRGLLGEDRYAMLGDNRSVSIAESGHAVVPSEAVLGRVVARVSPASALGIWFPAEPGTEE